MSKACLLIATFVFLPVPNAFAQLLNPTQIFEAGVTCPGDYPEKPRFDCTSNDIKLDLVELLGLVSCTEGEMATANFNIDLEVNANIRYNPMVWISSNAVDPRSTGEEGICFASSVPDGPIDHIPELIFSDANDCADIDVPNNNFTLPNLDLGPVGFLCVDTDNDGKAEIPMLVTWSNSGGADCEQGVYPIKQTPPKCDAFVAETDIDVVAEPGLELTKVGTLNDDDGTPGVSVGDTIVYTFSVENTGSVVLTNITLNDPVIGGPIASLAVGQTDTTTFTGSYAITQADIDAGSFTNTATAMSDEGATDDDNDTQDINAEVIFVDGFEIIL